MRVLYLANSSDIGGGNRFLLTLWESLMPLGVEVHAVVPEDGPMIEASRRIGVECQIVPHRQPSFTQPIQTWRAYRQWWGAIARLKPDIIHANGFETARAVVQPAASHRVPVIAHVHFKRPPEFARWAFRRLPKPAMMIFCSESTRRETGTPFRESCPASRQEVVYNSAVLDRFVPPPSRDHAVPRVGIVANLIPVKRHEDFLEMAAELTRRGLDAEYWIIGDDIRREGRREMLETMSRDLGLNGRAKFLGHCDHVDQILQQLDVLVGCADHEELPISMIEACACEVPIVATDVGGVSEIVEDGVTGFLAPRRSPHHLADGVEKLLRDPTARLTMGRNAREKALRLFNPHDQGRKIVELYQQVARPRTATACR